MSRPPRVLGSTTHARSRPPGTSLPGNSAWSSSAAAGGEDSGAQVLAQAGLPPAAAHSPAVTRRSPGDSHNGGDRSPAVPALQEETEARVSSCRVPGAAPAQPSPSVPPPSAFGRCPLPLPGCLASSCLPGAPPVSPVTGHRRARAPSAEPAAPSPADMGPCLGVTALLRAFSLVQERASRLDNGECLMNEQWGPRTPGTFPEEHSPWKAAPTPTSELRGARVPPSPELRPTGVPGVGVWYLTQASAPTEACVPPLTPAIAKTEKCERSADVHQGQHGSGWTV
ncbi:putative uncharacterized protein MGC34800 [Hippopotamus amphibius kiboko]|uniref:putative uncharacterized protein MGC34800 n=1 Tax=Hippopotamus amphibius kiboko TaxID=575201 RepID=UPI002593535C|nr:putative uncharacterized protein MGC34800 [Hippopotamus amphibius kiboko]